MTFSTAKTEAMDCLLRYFPSVTADQQKQLSMMKDAYKTWNAKINLISRKDEDAFYLHHVLHSLSIARVIDFPENAEVVDVGSGGGFPGMPLAILFPDTRFTLLDSTRKKILASEAIASALGIDNLSFVHDRAENHKQTYHYITARAVAPFPKFYAWTKHLINKSNDLSGQGIYYLKGGDLTDELQQFPAVQQFPINRYFSERYFETKKVIYLPF